MCSEWFWCRVLSPFVPHSIHLLIACPLMSLLCLCMLASTDLGSPVCGPNREYAWCGEEEPVNETFEAVDFIYWYVGRGVGGGVSPMTRWAREWGGGRLGKIRD